MHDGLTLAIVGRPNAGKSSLFNRLVERDRAIVTATPGTTRDLVTERISLDGIPLELVDTAGLREGFRRSGTAGDRRSREALADAAIVLVVLDATQPLNQEERGCSLRPWPPCAGGHEQERPRRSRRATYSRRTNRPRKNSRFLWSRHPR